MLVTSYIFTINKKNIFTVKIIKKSKFNLGFTESTVVFPANQKAESAQQLITAELVLVSFVSYMILHLQTQIKPNFFRYFDYKCGVLIMKV